MSLLDMFTSVQEFAVMMFSFLVIIIILQFVLLLRDFLTGILQSVLQQGSLGKMNKDNRYAMLANGLYYFMLGIVMIFLLDLFTNPPNNLPRDPIDVSLWDTLMTLLPLFMIFKTIVFFRDQFEEIMGARPGIATKR